MVQTTGEDRPERNEQYNKEQNTVQITRRDFLKALIIGGLSAAIACCGLSTILSYKSSQQLKEELEKYIATRTSYIPTSKPEQKTITITYIQPPVTETVTKTETVKETVTKTVTETRTETLTTPLPITTTVQRQRTLEEILFGSSNLKFIPLGILDSKVVGNNAYLRVENPYTKAELEIEIPVEYVSRSNINIADIVSAVRKYNSDNKSNYSVYFILGRANINQAIQQDGKWILPAPKIYYNIIISDREWEDVYNALQNLWNGNARVVMPTSQKGPYANSLWGWDNGNVIILYQNEQQVNSVVNYINLANSILRTPNNPNPSSHGILHVDTIADIQKLGVYENIYPVVGVKNYLGTYIVFIQTQGNQLFSNL